MNLLAACASMGAALVLFCADAHAKEIETLGPRDIPSLSIVVDPSTGTFMVVDSRMNETSTAAVFGGLIGAGVNSAINAQEDERKAEPFAETAQTLDIAKLVEAGLLETLSKRNFPVSDSSAHVLTIEIKDWGLSRISFGEAKSQVFLKVHVTMKEGRETVWDTYVKESGADAALLAGITKEQFAEQMTALATKAGKRIAYEIIYR